MFDTGDEGKAKRYLYDSLICISPVHIGNVDIGVVQLFECQPTNQRFASLIPSQGTCPHCGPGPGLGACKRQSHIDVSLPLFLLSSLSKNK